MSSYTQSQKKAILKWRDSNRDKYNAYIAIASKKYNDTHKTSVSIQKASYYAINKETILSKINNRNNYKKEAKRFRDILL
jgi:hypothetical protein